MSIRTDEATRAAQSLRAFLVGLEPVNPTNTARLWILGALDGVLRNNSRQTGRERAERAAGILDALDTVLKENS